MLLPILEFGSAGLLIWIIVTQILIPMLRGTPLFSALQRQGMEAKLQAARQELRIAELERELAEIKRQAHQVRLDSLNDELDRSFPTPGHGNETLEKGLQNVRRQPEQQ